MSTRKRKVKDVKKEEIQITKRGRQVKRVNYEMTNYLDDSSEEE